MAFIQQLVGAVADRGRELLVRNKGEPSADSIALCRELLSGRGEASGVALAREALGRYGELDSAGKLDFFNVLAKHFNPAVEDVLSAADAYRDNPSPEMLMHLNQVVEPPRQELLRRLNRAPGGTAALVAMRAELLELLPEQPQLAVIDADFSHLFSSWFNRGFLLLKRIDWHTSAAVLEKIIRYEAVHAIQDWDDLRRRLAPDRRCFAFFHPALTDEPLIFVEVALVDGGATGIQPLLDSNREEIDPIKDADTAVFYSISNCQAGLKGISFGSFLIKQVVRELSAELPKLKHFITLSPLPGFYHWLSKERQNSDGLLNTSTATQAKTKRQRQQLELRKKLQLLDNNDWQTDPESADRLRPALLALAAYYLLYAKTDGGKPLGGKPLDPVARFHLGNGARLEKINWRADRSEKGYRQSAGIMVNYAYVLRDIVKNHEAYANQNTVVASGQVRRLLSSDLRDGSQPDSARRTRADSTS